MKKSKKSLLVIALLLLVGLTSRYVASTYAKYTSTLPESTGTATVAKWAFTQDNTDAGTGNTRVGKPLTINLDGTYDASTLIGGKIAPGTSGSFAIALVNTNTETGVDWTITLNSIANAPTNLKFYKTRTEAAGKYSYSNPLTPGTSTITGKLAAKDATGISVPIYWVWEYETTNGDSIDTTAGEAANSLTISVGITGVQTRPSATAITSHID